MQLKMEQGCSYSSQNLLSPVSSTSLNISDEAEPRSPFVSETLRLIEAGEINEALHYLNVCLGGDKSGQQGRNGQCLESEIKNEEPSSDHSKSNGSGIRLSAADEVSLLEKRCLINMKLQHYDDVLDDARRILDKRTEHSLVYKCLLVALCKTDQLETVCEILKLWKSCCPQDTDMMLCRTKFEALMLAVKNGIDHRKAFSNIEQQLGLSVESFDWMLARAVQDPQWKFRPLPPGQSSFTLCLQFRYGHCPLGDAKCPDAHGAEELQEWNRRRTLRTVTQILEGIKLSSSEMYLRKIFDSLNNCDDPSEVLTENIPDGMIIKCSNPLSAKIPFSKSTPKKWIFAIDTQKPLLYICLLHDIHRQYFSIDTATGYGLSNQINLLEKAEFNKCNGVQVVEILNSNTAALAGKKSKGFTYKVVVKFKPEVYGNFRQSVVFDIGEKKKFVRHIVTEVVPLDDESKSEGGDISESPIFNQCSSYQSSTAWNFSNADILDSTSGEKVPPAKLGFTLFNNVGKSSLRRQEFTEPLTKENYVEKMRYFLTQEERSRQEILAKYNLTTQVSLSEMYSMTSGLNLSRYAVNGALFGCMTLFRDVSEDTAVGRLILRGCNYILMSKTKPKQPKDDCEDNKTRVFLCPIVDKTKNNIFIDIGQACVREWDLKNSDVVLFDIQFQLDRTAFIEMKSVIEKLQNFHLDMLFPDFSPNYNIPWTPLKQWDTEVSTFAKLNPRQKEALIAVTSENTGIPPILMIGPFGTGKTFTLAQCIRKLLKEDNVRIMVCTHSNSAADLYIKDYLDRWFQDGITEAKPLRVYYHQRNLNSVHPDVLQYCIVDNLKFRTPKLEEIMAHKVIVVTLSTSYLLMDLPKDTFSHILLDEAAQAMESEAITPLMCAGKNTKLVLAGDHMQLSPELFSEEAKSLHPSLLERLHNLYPHPHPCKLMLCENYRSHTALIDYVSDAFYNKRLQCSMVQPVHDTYYPLTFFSARGEEVQDNGSTSYYNMAEVFEIVDKVSQLVQTWPKSWGNYRLENAISVLTPYSDQVSRIRSALRKKGLYSVSVERVLNVQGKQFRAVFLSTVRSFRPWVKILEGISEAVGNEVDLGFFSNPKLLNTALTRAQSLVAVVGDPVSLCSEGKCRNLWKDFINICHNNKSLYGISYSQLEQNILGIELRVTWGLNPLADIFEPTALNLQYSAVTPSSPNSKIAAAKSRIRSLKFPENNPSTSLSGRSTPVPVPTNPPQIPVPPGFSGMWTPPSLPTGTNLSMVPPIPYFQPPPPPFHYQQQNFQYPQMMYYPGPRRPGFQFGLPPMIPMPIPRHLQLRYGIPPRDIHSIPQTGNRQLTPPSPPIPLTRQTFPSLMNASFNNDMTSTLMRAQHPLQQPQRPSHPQPPINRDSYNSSGPLYPSQQKIVPRIPLLPPNPSQIPNTNNLSKLTMEQLTQFYGYLETLTITSGGGTAESRSLMLQIRDAMANASPALAPDPSEISTRTSLHSGNVPSQHLSRLAALNQQLHEAELSSTVDSIWANLGFSETSSRSNIPRPSIKLERNSQDIIPPAPPLQLPPTNSPWNQNPLPLPVLPAPLLNIGPRPQPQLGQLTAQLSTNVLVPPNPIQRPALGTFPSESRSYANVVKRTVTTAAPETQPHLPQPITRPSIKPQRFPNQGQRGNVGQPIIPSLFSANLSGPSDQHSNPIVLPQSFIQDSATRSHKRNRRRRH